MPRLFTGLEIPADLALTLTELRGGLPGATWIDPENYHVTLRFIGDVDERIADEIADALARVRRPAFDVRIRGIDYFGGRQPHSVFAKVEPTPALMELQAEHERIMQRLGLDPEGRKYHPHITIARVKGAQARDVAHWLDVRGGFPGGRFRAERAVLFSSRASKGGGPYIVEDEYPFVAAAPATRRDPVVVARMYPRAIRSVPAS
ncbi:RNA 2',3'-cyclic phosphodiesterase [Prosthecomicrobium hirschii]|uniref:RNA 2',3'-cyclic phosphodiesterase n=1 Tax=Prosthecodimorpha hirschii TaxID=665126 RepID=A0A0P6WGC7_9HYPH|nr:RNA 2',3'-cyclic phosphodiesterase [Prosthecomicrobium hirschii]KPL53739.1 2'-5' RNA ligase [Prosthecomicrobium hirschii]MCW1842861.1 RNA 2',3'-cyclic phosphodiesterase [Prosthecomicrobium hirschii]